MSTTIHWSLRRNHLYYGDQQMTNLPHTSCFLCRHFAPTTAGGVGDDLTQYWSFEDAKKGYGNCEKLITRTQVSALEDNCADFQPTHIEDAPTHAYFALQMRNIAAQQAWAQMRAMKKELKAEKAKATMLRTEIRELKRKLKTAP